MRVGLALCGRLRMVIVALSAAHDLVDMKHMTYRRAGSKDKWRLAFVQRFGIDTARSPFRGARNPLVSSDLEDPKAHRIWSCHSPLWRSAISLVAHGQGLVVPICSDLPYRLSSGSTVVPAVPGM